LAQIGLKIRGSETGTDLATTLANALMGDPKDEAYLARTRSQIENDEVSRRQGEQDILYRQALTAAAAGEEARKAQDAQYDAQAVPYYSQMGVDAMGNPVPAPAPATEAPAIVLESGGRGLPEHLFNADPRHQAIEPPVPIEIGTTSPSELPPGTIADSFLAQRGAPGALTDSRVPQGDLSYALPAMPPQLAGVPPELAQAPPPAGPVVGGAADSPIVGGGQPLIDLAALLGGGPAEEPVPVLPDDYLTPFQGYDDIAPRAEPGMVPMESLPEAPVPVEPPNIGMVPEDMFTPNAPEDEVVRTRMPQALHDLMAGEPPPAVDPAPTSAVPAEPPVPVAEPGAPTSAAAEPVPPTPPQAAPAAAPTMPERSTLTIKGADDGKADTATTVQTTRAGPIPREGVEAMVRSIMVGEGSPEAKMQAVQRLMGTLGATYNPQFGQEGQEPLTENLASLRQGGTALGRESVLGTDAAIKYATETGDIKTTMIGERAYTLAKTPDGRTVATLVEGQPAPEAASRFGESAEGAMRESLSTMLVSKPDPKTWTPKEKQDYAIMADALYGAKVTVSENGKITVTEGDLPAGVLPGDAGFNPQEPPPPAGQPAEGQAAPAAPAAQPPAAQPPVEGARPTETINGVQVKNYGGWLRTGEQPKQTTSDTAAGKVTQIEGTGPTDMDEQVGKEFGYTKNVLTPGKYLLDLTADKVPNVAGQVIQAVTSNNSLLQTLGSMALSPQEREYFQNVQRFINAVTHKSSGADVTAADLRTYGYLFSLPPKEAVKGSDLRILKNGVLEDIKNSRTGWNGRVPSEQLREFDIELSRTGYDLDKVYTDEDAGASTSQVRRRRVGADGKLEDAN
jgi:hypothetical protein